MEIRLNNFSRIESNFFEGIPSKVFLTTCKWSLEYPSKVIMPFEVKTPNLKASIIDEDSILKSTPLTLRS